MEISDLFKSSIINNRILLIEPGNTLHTFGFSGLNFEYRTDYDAAETIEDFQKIKNSHYNYIFIHGFLARELHNKLNLNQLRDCNISCDDFIIDYLGEGYSIHSDMVYIIRSIYYSFKINKVKLLHPIHDDNSINYKFPYIEDYRGYMVGPKVFCGPHNFMFHSVTENNFDSSIFKNSTYVYGGTKWSSDKKPYLYMCLNNREQIHREFMINSLLNSNIKNNGILSCRFGNDIEKTYLLYDESNLIEKKIKLPNITPIEDMNSRFGPNIHFSKNSYIDVVTETAFENTMFITEKSMKPFFNLQLPLILGPTKIIEVLREYGFDLFDDIINHEYDKIPHPENIYDDLYQVKLNKVINTKAEFIKNELERISKLNIHDIYISIYERLLKNQNLANKICIDDNTLLDDIGQWIFGDSIKFHKVITYNKVFL